MVTAARRDFTLEGERVQLGDVEGLVEQRVSSHQGGHRGKAADPPMPEPRGMPLVISTSKPKGSSRDIPQSVEGAQRGVPGRLARRSVTTPVTERSRTSAPPIRRTETRSLGPSMVWPRMSKPVARFPTEAGASAVATSGRAWRMERAFSHLTGGSGRPRRTTVLASTLNARHVRPERSRECRRHFRTPAHPRGFARGADSVPWEATVSYGSGAADGPAAILKASHQVDLLDRDTGKP